MEKTGTLLEITLIMKESLDAEQNQQTLAAELTAFTQKW